MCSSGMFYHFDRKRAILMNRPALRPTGTPSASALAVGGKERMKEQV